MNVSIEFLAVVAIKQVPSALLRNIKIWEAEDEHLEVTLTTEHC